MRHQRTDKQQLRTIWRIPDDLWAELHPLLPPEKPRNTRGRPVVPFRQVMDGILYVLRTGCQWKMLSTAENCTSFNAGKLYHPGGGVVVTESEVEGARPPRGS